MKNREANTNPFIKAYYLKKTVTVKTVKGTHTRIY